MDKAPCILMSRTDSIGDVVLTLPMAGILKSKLPGCRIIFLGRTYTRDVIELSEHVDDFLNYDDLKTSSHDEQIHFFKNSGADCILHVFPKKEIALLAEQAGIPVRVGTLSRLYHWYTCNRKVHLPRKNSKLHEAQLNLKLLSALGIQQEITLNEIHLYYGFTRLNPLPEPLKTLPDTNRFNLILHPKSKGSAREWGLDNFKDLIALLPSDKYKLFISGTLEEGMQLQEFITKHPMVTDLTGKMNLKEFISFIKACDGLIAASTGPLHIAAALGKTAIGLFAPMRPIHPGRWKPLGEKAHALALDKTCEDCRKSMDCHCIREIKPQQVAELLKQYESI